MVFLSEKQALDGTFFIESLLPLRVALMLHSMRIESFLLINKLKNIVVWKKQNLSFQEVIVFGTVFFTSVHSTFWCLDSCCSFKELMFLRFPLDFLTPFALGFLPHKLTPFS